MIIGVHTRYLEKPRIDGTAVYLHNILRRLPPLLADAQLHYYHTDDYHPELSVAAADNVRDVRLRRAPVWTQTAFAAALWRNRCDVAWLPMHTLPLVRRRTMRTVVTIHDLAFKLYPDTFPRRDVRMLNLLTDYAATHADALIAVSETTKRDVMRFYPHIDADRIHVVYHGFDATQWQTPPPRSATDALRRRYGIGDAPYMIHVGALQPRKNLTFLVDAFARVKASLPHVRLVLIGGDGWKAEGIHAHVARSPFRADIIVTGNIPFADVVTAVHGAHAGVLPSLYEGFGIPGLEMLAAGTPVASADASCFSEVYGDAVAYFDPHDIDACAIAIVRVCTDDALRAAMVRKGRERVRQFTWQHSAAHTAHILRNTARR